MCDKRKVAGSIIVLAVFLLVFGLAGLVQAGQEGTVLGNLMAHKSVLIESQGADIRITDTTYAYFGGDRVRTGDKSSAAVRLGNDGALYLGPATVGAVTRSADEYVVDLEKGGVRFAFEEGIPFRIVTADVSVRPGSFLRVAESGSGRVSGVVMIDDGNPVIHTLTGTLVVHHYGSGVHRTIKVGEAVALDSRSGNFVKVVFPETRKGFHDEDSFEAGASEDDSSEAGAYKDGASKSGASEAGTSKAGASEAGASEAGEAAWNLTRAGQAFAGVLLGGGAIALTTSGGGGGNNDNDTSPAK
ncbi:MAG: hypothetical protein V3R51_01580 [Gammaproteobacteria bacterium]